MKPRLQAINHSLLFVVLLTVILYFGRPILVPVSFALLLAMLMAPLCRRLDRKGLPRALSCFICVFILLLVFLVMIGIMMAQLSGFIQNLPHFEERANELITTLHRQVEKMFDVPVDQQTEFLKSETTQLSRSLVNYLTRVLRSSIQLVIGMLITLVFTFLMLFHKEKYYAFFLKFSGSDTHKARSEILNSIALVAQQYLIGRAICIAALFLLYVLAMWLIGIEGALLLGAVAALFNIIPYVGPVLAAVVPFITALVSEAHWEPAVWLLLSLFLIQAIDNYFLTPYFTGGEVSLSALSTFVIMICGGFLWGIAGMILFVPLLAIVKIVLDKVPGLEHYGQLIGNEGKRPTKKIKDWFRKVFASRRKEP